MKTLIILLLIVTSTSATAQKSVRSIVSVMTTMDSYWSAKQIDSLLQIKSDSIKILYSELVRIKKDSTAFKGFLGTGSDAFPLEPDLRIIYTELANLKKRIDDIIAVLPVKPGELIK